MTKFEIPNNAKAFTVKQLESGDFEIVYEIEQKKRAEIDDEYFFISGNFDIEEDTENDHHADDTRFEAGNYFLIKKDAEEAAELLKETLKNFWIKRNETQNSSN